MKVWIYVEGESDRLGLEALLADWRGQLSKTGWGLVFVRLQNKGSFLKHFGERSAEKLVGNLDDLVVGLPDLYPTTPYLNSEFEHKDASSLKDLQRRQVTQALEQTQRRKKKEIPKLLERLWPSVFKHDFEMLLLAAVDALRSHLNTSEKLENWRMPVEHQNCDRPPKRVVEELFLTKSPRRKAYRDTKDAPAVLKRVKDLRDEVLRARNHTWKCPEFKEMLDWLGKKTKVPAFSQE